MATLKYKAPTRNSIEQAKQNGQYLLIAHDKKGSKSIANYDKIWNGSTKMVDGKEVHTPGNPALIFNALYNLVGTREALDAVYLAVMKQMEKPEQAIEENLPEVRGYEIRSDQEADFKKKGTLAFNALAAAADAKKTHKEEKELVGQNVKITPEQFVEFYRMARPIPGTSGTVISMVVRGPKKPDGSPGDILGTKKGSKKNGKAAKQKLTPLEKYRSKSTDDKGRLLLFDITKPLDSGKASFVTKAVDPAKLSDWRKKYAIADRFMFNNVKQVERALRDMYGDNYNQVVEAQSILAQAVKAEADFNRMTMLPSAASVPLHVGNFIIPQAAPDAIRYN